MSDAYSEELPYFMRMGNYLCVECYHRTVMAATQPTFGIRHLTVVPTNFDPAGEETDDRDEQ